MPEVTLDIGGRSFRVSCQPGEEENLRQAAQLLDGEAEALQSAIGRVPEPRMLLMAGLMLADRLIEIARHAETVEQENARLRKEASRAGTQNDAAARRAADEALEVLEKAAQRAEKLAGL